MIRWLGSHWRAVMASLGRIGREPVASLLIVLTMGVALSLPAGGYALLRSVENLSGQVTGTAQLTAFLSLEASRSEVAAVEGRLKASKAVARHEFVPRDRALEQLKRNAGLADVVESLKDNPLPDAFIVQPASGAPDALEKLQAEMRQWPRVEHVQLDSEWARRLHALLRLAEAAVGMLAALLGVALVAGTFNTIRLQILARRDEIEVSKLIGATNRFIRRPFVWFGTVQGLLGGAAAWLIVAGTVAVLNRPVAQLAELYGSTFRLSPLGWRESLALLGLAAALGWLGAWLSVGRHLREIDPR